MVTTSLVRAPLMTLLWLSLCTLACNPVYQSTRAHIPQQQQAGEFQVELSESQVDVGYAITDQVSVSVGGLYLTQTESSTTGSTANKQPSGQTFSRDSTLYGGHFGLGYTLSLAKDRSTHLNVSAGGAFQRWVLESDLGEGDPVLSLDGFTDFNATVINPFSQVALTLGSMITNFSLLIRAEYPMFDFQDTRPVGEEAAGQPFLLNYGLQAKLGHESGLSGFFQLLLRRNFDDKHFDNPDFNNGYSVSSWNAYLGLSYAFGGESKRGGGAQSDDQVKVSHDE